MFCLAPIKELGRIKDRLKRTRYFVYSFISVWKMMLFFSSMLLFLHLNGSDIGPLFSKFQVKTNEHQFQNSLPKCSASINWVSVGNYVLYIIQFSFVFIFLSIWLSLFCNCNVNAHLYTIILVLVKPTS